MSEESMIITSLESTRADVLDCFACKTTRVTGAHYERKHCERRTRDARSRSRMHANTSKAARIPCSRLRMVREWTFWAGTWKELETRLVEKKWGKRRTSSKT